MAELRRIVVVGAGLAGVTAAVVLRREGFDGDLTLVGAEPSLPYDRPPLSKEYLRGDMSFEAILLRPPDFYTEAGIDARFGIAAERIDASDRTVVLAGGDRLPYDALLVATGSRNRRLRIPGADLDGVVDLRVASDSDRIRAAAAAGRTVIVGMGFIGSEVAASLRALGVAVTVIEVLASPLASALGAEVGPVLEGIHRDHGVEMVFGDAPEAFEGAGRVERVVTRRGRRLDAGVVVVGVGVEPVTGLVEEAGAAVDDGVIVDASCRTSVEGIFAAGDVTRHDHPLAGQRLRVEHWDNALKQGEAAARSMLGTGRPYDEVHWLWSDFYDHNLQWAGFPGPYETAVTRGSLESRSFATFYLRDGRLRAAMALDRGRDVRAAMRLIRAQVPLAPDALADEARPLRAMLG